MRRVMRHTTIHALIGLCEPLRAVFREARKRDYGIITGPNMNLPWQNAFSGYFDTEIVFSDMKCYNILNAKNMILMAENTYSDKISGERLKWEATTGERKQVLCRE